MDAPYYWENENADPIMLPLPVGTASAKALSISLDGVVVGEAWVPGLSYAVAWRVVSGSVFGPVVLSACADAYSVAISGADTNRVVGVSEDFGATAWDLALELDGSFSVTNAFSLIPGEPGGIATAITDDGDVTGRVWRSNGDFVAFAIRSGSLRYLSNARREHYGAGLRSTPPPWSARPARPLHRLPTAMRLSGARPAACPSCHRRGPSQRPAA